MADTNTKAVNFKFVVDQQSFAQVKGALQELTQQATKFAEAMKAAGGGFFGGGNVGAGVGGRSVAQTKAGAAAGAGAAGGPVGAAGAAIKDTADKSVTALQKMTTELRRGVQQQKQDLGELGKALDSIVQKFTGISGISGRLLGAMGPSYKGGGGTGGLGMAGSFTGTPGLGGGGFSAADLAIGGGGMGLAGFAGGATAIIGAAKLAQKAFLAYRSSEREGMQIAGQYGQTFLRPYESLRGGDISDLVATGSLGVGERRAIENQRGAGGDWEYFSSHPFASTGRAIGGAFFGDDRYAQGREAFKEGNRQAMLEAKKKQFGFQSEFSDPKDYFESTIDARLQASRILGLVTGTDRMEGGKYLKGYDSFHSKLWEQGYDDPAFLAAKVGMRTMVGNAGAHSAWAAMAANTAGYSGYENVLAAGVRAGNAGAAYTMGGPLRRDQQMAIQLGSLALGSGFDPMGTTGGLGVLAVTQGAVGLGMGTGVSTPNLIARAQEGIKSGEGIFSDSSPLQAGRNLLAAIQANPQGGVYAQTAMTQLSYRQVQDIVNGNGVIPQNLKNLGVTREMVGDYYKTVQNNTLSDYATTGNSKVDQAVRRFRGSNLTLDAYMQQNAGDRGLLETAMQAAHPEMFSTEGAIGLGDQFAAGGTKLSRGAGPSGPMDATIRARRKMQADFALDQGGRLNEIQGQLKSSYENARAAAGALNRVTSNADSTADALTKFGTAVVGATDAIRSWFGGKGGGGGKKTAPNTPQKGK